jgi:hypothetical protein
MNRLITVLKITFLGFVLTNLLISIIFFLESVIEGTEMPWEYLGYVTIYGMIVSIIFGYMDRPILEKRLLIGITICTAIIFTASFLIDNQILRMQSLYLFFGIVMGRKMVLLVDMTLKKEKSSN